MLGLLTDDAGIAEFGAEWAQLWRGAGGTPFQSPAWLLAWWGTFGSGHPRIATLREGGRLVGVLPMYLLPDEGKVLPIGAGITDNHDVLLDPSAPAGAASALLGAVLAADRLPCHLTELPPGSLLRVAEIGAEWDGRLVEGETCPVLALGRELRDTVPPRQHRKLRMARNRAAEIGGFAVEAATQETAMALFGHLTRLHGARWRAQGQTGVLDDRAVQAFHAAAMPALFEAGLLRLQAVRLGGEIAAVIYAMIDGGGRIHFYLSGFDEGFARESPGTLLLGAMLEQAVAEGRHEARFLRGEEGYKFAWGAQATANATRIITPT